MSAASVLLLGMLVGLPAMLLALVLGYVATGGMRARRPGPAAVADDEAGAASGLLRELQRSVVDINRQLGGQREALSRLLSERRRAAAEKPAAIAADAAAAPRRAAPAMADAAGTAMAAPRTQRAPGAPGEQRAQPVQSKQAPARRATAPAAPPAPSMLARNRGGAAAAASGPSGPSVNDDHDALRDVLSSDVLSTTPSAADVARQQVIALAAEGLSDRAIARRLHIGLEEVRLLALAVQPAERAS